MVKDIKYLAPLGSSDHVVLRFNLMSYTSRKEPKEAKLNYAKGNYDLLRELLAKVDWAPMHDSDVHGAYDFFQGTLQGVIDIAVPKMKLNGKKKNLYMNRHALRLRRQKETLRKTYKHSKDAIDFARFCRCRNKLRATTRSLRKEFERKLLGEAKSDQKCFWKYANSRLNPRPAGPSPDPTLCWGGGRIGPPIYLRNQQT